LTARKTFKQYSHVQLESFLFAASHYISNLNYFHILSLRENIRFKGEALVFVEKNKKRRLLIGVAV